MSLRFEAWTLPTSGTFEKKFDVVDAIFGAGVRALSEYSDESLSLPSSSDLIDEIVTDTAGSWIRAYDGSTIVDEFRADRVAIPEARPSVRQISGPQRNGLVEGIAIYPKNWPNDKEDAQDWKWGYENALPPLGLGDLGSISAEYELFTDATGGTFTITVGADTTEAFAFDATAKTIEGSVPADTGLQGLSTVNDVAVSGEGTADDPWIITFYNPPIPGTVSVDDTNLTGGTATLTQTVAGGLDPSPITKSKPVDAGAGSESEHGSYVNPAIEVVTTNLDTDADWALKVNALTRFAGSQLIVDVTPGETYSASIRVKPDTTSTFKFVIRDVFGNHIDQAGGTLTAGSYQTLTITDMVIPGNVSQIIFRIAVVDSTPANIDTFYVNWQGATLTSGEAEATFTQIIGELLDAAHDRGTAEFLERDATDGADSNGTSLDPISFSVFFGGNAHLGHVLNDGARSGYHWRIVPAVDAKVITPTGSHVLQIFKATNGEIEDQTATAGGASITVGGKVESAETVRRIPPYTTILSHGAGALTREDTDATAESNMGRIERVLDAEPFGTDAELLAFNTSRFAEEAANRKAASAVVLESDSSRPLVDYEEGSKVWWNFGSNLPKEARVVKRIAWTHGNVARYEVQGSSRLTPEAAMAKAVDFLLNQPVRRRGAGGGLKSSDLLPFGESHEHNVHTKLLTSKGAPGTTSSINRQAVYDQPSNRTYFAYLGLERDLYVTYYDHESDAVGPVVEVGTYPIADNNNHGVPSMILDLDGYVHIVWGQHGTQPNHSKSNSPRDISAWTTQSLPGNSTYDVINCDPATGDLYTIGRAGDSIHTGTFPSHEYGALRKSTDGGANWSALTEIVDTTGAPETDTDFYPVGGILFGPDGYLHFCWTVARGTGHDAPAQNFYHAKYDPADGNLYTASGTSLGTNIDWTDHTSCLAATRGTTGTSDMFVAAEDRIAILYTASPSTPLVYMTVWDGSSWTDTSTGVAIADEDVSNHRVYWARDGWRALIPADDGTFSDIKLYAASTDGTLWTELDTILAGSSGEGYAKVVPVAGDGPIVALTMEDPSGHAVTSATASDLLPVYAVFDPVYVARIDNYLTEAQHDSIVHGGGSGSATLASTTLTNDVAAVLTTWEQWGTEEVVISDPGAAVVVWAMVSGTVIYNQPTAARRLGAVRVGISFDNGSTWQYGNQGEAEVRGADLRTATIVGQHLRSGTPTADIQIRAELQQVTLGTAGDVNFNRGTLSVMMS